MPTLNILEPPYRAHAEAFVSGRWRDGGEAGETYNRYEVAVVANRASPCCSREKYSELSTDFPFNHFQIHCTAKQITHLDVFNYPAAGRLLLSLIMERQTLTHI